MRWSGNCSPINGIALPTKAPLFTQWTMLSLPAPIMGPAGRWRLQPLPVCRKTVRCEEEEATVGTALWGCLSRLPHAWKSYTEAIAHGTTGTASGWMPPPIHWMLTIRTPSFSLIFAGKFEI